MNRASFRFYLIIAIAGTITRYGCFIIFVTVVVILYQCIWHTRAFLVDIVCSVLIGAFNYDYVLPLTFSALFFIESARFTKGVVRRLNSSLLTEGTMMSKSAFDYIILCLHMYGPTNCPTNLNLSPLWGIQLVVPFRYYFFHLYVFIYPIFSLLHHLHSFSPRTSPWCRELYTLPRSRRLERFIPPIIFPPLYLYPTFLTHSNYRCCCDCGRELGFRVMPECEGVFVGLMVWWHCFYFVCWREAVWDGLWADGLSCWREIGGWGG